ncbi:MAG: hypothetical protein A2X77_00035 [Gammaproteobacteria bacterium GWE2_42_36]|nr:MAG: hypothetical protein A2X77_00035 [Gammaproteobacteria bacterium GWE2_42_36]HCU04970.1 hypothetical protein [Coxiellaceae bacterium]
MWSDAILIDQLETYVTRKQYAQSYEHLTLVFTALLGHEQELESDQIRRFLSAVHFIVLELGALAKPQGEALTLDKKIYLKITEFFERLTIVAKRNPAFALEFNEILQAFYLEQGNVYRALARGAYHQPEQGYLDARQKYSTALEAYHKSWRISAAAQQGQAALRISQTIAEIRYSIIREDYRSTYDPHESVRQLTEYGMYQEAEHYDDAFMGFYQHIITTASKQLNLNDDAAQYRALVEIVLPFLDKLESDGKIQAGIAIAGTLYRNGKTTEDEFARNLLARYTHLTNVGQGTEPAVRHELLLPVSRWESEKARLRALRGRFDDIPTTTYRAIQKQYTQEIVAFLGDKAHRAAQLFQHAPCRYQLVGLGSMAREEMNRFSDADIGMLLEDSEALKSDPDRPDKLVEVKRFFTKWFDLFTLELEALGETEAHSGLFFDDMNKGSLSKVLQGYVNTPQGILTELSPQSLITSQTLFEDHSFYAWYRGVIPIYGGGAQSAQHLVREYRALLWQALREGEKHRAIAERYLTTHLQLFAQKALTDEIDLKERFIRPFTYLYSDLGLYYGIEAYDLEGIVEGLKRSDMDPAFLQVFQSQHQFIHDLRCRVHRHYGEEHDTVSLAEGANPTPGATYHLDPADRKGLAGVHGFLQSMARQIPRLLAQKTTQPFNPITEDFRCLLLADFNAALIEMQKEFTRQINTPQAIDLEAYYRLRLQIEELEKRLIALHKRSLWTEAKVLLYQQLFDEFKDLRKSLLFKYEARPKERYWIEIPSSKMTQAAALQAKIADWIQQDQAQLAPLVPEDFIHQHPEMIRAQVELLIKQQSSLQAYQALYVLLPFYWQERLIERLPRETYELLRPFLDSHPLPDGTRPGVMRDRVQFEEGLKSLFLPASSTPTTDRSAITLAYATFTQAQEVSGRLKPEIAAQFQSIPERLAAERPRSATSDRSHNHLVFPIMIDGQSYHIKVFPEFPVFEIAVSLLYDSIIGCCGVSKSVLACVTIVGQDYPILISQTVPGVPLDEYLKTQANPSIDKFSQLALMHLLLPPEDAKKQNFVYHPLLNTIIGIDNDHVFTPPVLERTLRRDQIMIKAVLFCFDQMKRPFSEESTREFLALTPLYVLDLWLKGLHHYALQAKQLFKAENVSVWERAKIPKSTENRYYQNSVVSFQLPSELVNRLYQQMMTIQHLLKQNAHITPYELLGLLAPSISEYYGRLLSLPEASVSERFAHVERELYGPAVQSSQYLTIVKSVGSRLMPIAHPEQSCTIPQSQRELAKVDQQYHLVFGMRARLEQGESAKIIEGLLPYFQVQIMNHLDWSVLSTAQQKALLVRLADPQLNTVMRKLTIRGCQLLTDSLLERILAGKTYLQALHIEFCDELIEMILPDLPQLRRLEVRRCFSLQKIRAPKEGNLIVLNQLKIIALEHCRHLTIVDIQFNHEMKDECYSVELGIHQYLIRGHERAERFLSIAIEKWKTDEPRGFSYLEAWYYRGLAALCLGERELALRCFARVMQGHILLLGSCLREGEGNPRLAEQLEQLWTDYKIEIMTKLMTHNEGASSASSSSEPSPQNLMMVLTILQEKQRNRMAKIYARIFASLLIDASARQDLMMNAKTYLFARMKEVLIAAAIPAPFPLLFGPDIAPLPEEAVRTLAEKTPIPAAINNPVDLRHLFRTLNLQTINRQWGQFFSLPMVRERLPAKNPEVMQAMDKLYLPDSRLRPPIVSREEQLMLKQKPQPRYSFSELCAAGIPLSEDSVEKYSFAVPGRPYRVACCGYYGKHGLQEATGLKDPVSCTPTGVNFTLPFFTEVTSNLQFAFEFRWLAEQGRFMTINRSYIRGCKAALFFQGDKGLRFSFDVWYAQLGCFNELLFNRDDYQPPPCVLVTFSDNPECDKMRMDTFKHDARVTHHIQIPYGSTLSPQELCAVLTGIPDGHFVKSDRASYETYNQRQRQREAEYAAASSGQELASSALQKRR